MPRERLIIYCDESDEKGKYFSHFYGGALIKEPDREAIENLLRAEKERLNLFKELKWTNISEQYEEKYTEFIGKYFDLIDEKRIKVRILFTQNINVPIGLEEHQIDNQYFLLYYQLVKNAFGLRYCNPNVLDEIFVRLFLDDIPDNPKNFEKFKEFTSALTNWPAFFHSNVAIPKNDIASVKSHDHVILQGLDIILGAMQFRLNDKHLLKEPGARIRGKRTRAKERVYKYINKRIRDIYPNFNIGASTGQERPEDKWHHPYRHWLFKADDHIVDRSRGVKNRK